jgi:small subunit ribosomal protein S16
MLKFRLKRTGRKRQPSYRLVVMESTSRRNGRPIDEVGYYNPITKELYVDEAKINTWKRYGVKATETANYVFKRAGMQ